MTAPLRTAGQFLSESGFGNALADYASFPEYPDLNAQLQALRKLDANAPEIPWVEYALAAARQARLDDDKARETHELATARNAIAKSFKRRTPAGQWPTMVVVLGLIALVAVLVWMEGRKRKRLRRRQNIPEPRRLAAPDDDDEDEDESEEENPDDEPAEDEDDA